MRIDGSDKSGCGKFLHISVTLLSQLHNKFVDIKNTSLKDPNTSLKEEEENEY